MAIRQRPAHSVPENILAFRTITTLLSYIPRAHPIDTVDNLYSLECNDAQAVNITSAFAQLANADFDVVAAAIKYDLNAIEVTSCVPVKPSSTDEAVAKPENSGQQTGILASVVRGIESISSYCFTFVRNDRIGNPNSHSLSNSPSLCDTEAPDDLRGRTALSYMVNMESNWSAPSLSTHLWLLCNIFADYCNDPDADNAPTYLTHIFRYVAATGHQKILSRFANSRVGRPFVRALQRIDAEAVPLPSHSLNVAHLVDELAIKESDELKHDRLFLTDFIGCKTKDSLVNESEIPNLLDLASRSAPPKLLYTDETCREFHKILLYLLEKFEESLREVAVMAKGKDTPPSDKFKKNLSDVQVYAYALLRLANGHALTAHLTNLGPLLCIKPNSNGKSMCAMQESNQSGQERDDDMEAVSPEDHISWLRLSLSHFEAVEIIISFLMSRRGPLATVSTSIKAQILLSPLASDELLPWRDLLKSSKYFPEPKQDAPDVNKDLYSQEISVSNTALLEFLERIATEASKAQTLSGSASSALAKWEDRNTSSFDLNSLKQSVSDLAELIRLEAEHVDLNATAAAVLEDLGHWNEATANENNITANLEKLVDRLRTPPGFGYIANLANDKQTFKGSIHCEMCLASFLDNFTQHGQHSNNINYLDVDPFSSIISEMGNYQRVIGVSKLCCPVCYRFLGKLTSWAKSLPFIFQGAHSTITTCTLPPWTPSEIVDDMVQHYAALLRNDLIQLKKSMEASSKKPGYLRNRSDSTGSTALVGGGSLKIISQRAKSFISR